MSEVDNKVIKMEFNNSKFNKNIERASSVLDKFKEKLNFKKESKEAKELDNSINKISFAQFAKEAALAVPGVTALINITNRLVDSAISLGKSMTIQPLTTGFDKYESSIISTKTIMNATGKTIDEVTKSLEQLTWYSDETSYSFDTMADSVGKFTAAGIGLEDSISAVQGIANWAAVSGAGIQKASIAMYNLSQALAMGRLTAIDWKSIEQANMATEEFKNTVIATAKELGVLNAQSKTKSGFLVTAANFREALSQGVVTNEVLIASLKKYASYSDEVYSVATVKGLSAAKAMEILGKDMDNLGVKAFLAAQEAKTFSESIQATKDAVASGWQKTYEIIFGNYQEATKIWTAFTDALWDIFVAGSKVRNEQLQIWKDMGGREKLLQGISIAFENISEAINTAREAFKEVIPPITAQTVMNLTNNFVEFAKSLKSSESGLSLISSVSKIVAYLFKTIGLVLKSVLTIIKTVLPLLEPVVSALALLAQEVSNFISFIIDGQNGISLFRLALNGLAFVIEVVAGALSLLTSVLASAIDSFRKSEFLQGIVAFLKNIIPKLQTLGNKLLKRVKDIYKKLKDSKALEYLKNFFIVIGAAIAGAIVAVGKAIEKFINKVKNSKIVTKTIEFFITLGEKIKALFEAIGNAGENAWDSIKNFFENIGDGVESGWNKVKEAFKKVLGWMAPFFAIIGGFFKKLWDWIKGLDLWNAFKALDLKGMAQTIMYLALAFKLVTSALKTTKVFNSLSAMFKGIARKENSEAFRNIAISIAILAGSMALLSKVSDTDITQLALALGLLAAIVITFLAAANQASERSFADFLIPDKKFKVSIIALIGLAFALRKFVESVKELAAIEDPLKMASAGFFMVACLALIDALFYFANQSKELSQKAGVIKTTLTTLSLLLGVFKILKILAGVISEIASIGDPIAIATAGGTLALLAIFIATISKLISRSSQAGIKDVLKLSLVMGSLSGALWIISTALERIAAFSADDKVYKRVTDLLIGIGAVLAALTVIGVVTKEDFKGAADLAITLSAIAAALSVLSFSLETYANMDPKKIGPMMLSMAAGLVILTAGLTALIGISHLLSKTPQVLGTLAAIVGIVSGAILIMAGSFFIFVNTLGLATDVLKNLGPALNNFVDNFLIMVDKIRSKRSSIEEAMQIIAEFLPVATLTGALLTADPKQLGLGGLFALAIGIGAAAMLFGAKGLNIGSALSAIALLNTISLVVLAMAGVMRIVKKVDPETLIAAALAIDSFLIVLAVAIRNMANIDIGAKKVISNAVAASLIMNSLAALLLSIVGMMALVKNIDWKVLVASLVGISALFMALSLPLKQLRGIRFFKEGMSSLLMIASIAGLLVAACWSLTLIKDVPIGHVAVALLGLAVVLSSLALPFLAAKKLSSVDPLEIAAFVASFASVIAAVALVGLAMQGIEFRSIIAGMLGIIGVIITVAAVTKEISKISIDKVGKLLGLVLAIVPIIGAISLVFWGLQGVKSGAAIGAAAGLVITVGLLSKLVATVGDIDANKALKAILIMLSLAAPLLAFAATIWAIGEKDWSQIVPAFVGLSIVIALLTKATAFLAQHAKDAFTGAVSLAVISGALLALLPTLWMFSNGAVGKMLLGLGGALVILGSIVVAAATLTPLLSAGAAGIGIFLLAVLGLSGATLIFASAMDMMSIATIQFGEGFAAIGNALPILGNGIIEVVDAVGIAILNIVGVFGKASKQFWEIAKDNLAEFLALQPMILQSIMAFGTAIYTALFSLGTSIISGFWNGIINGVAQIFAFGKNVASGFAKGIEDSSNEVYDASNKLSQAAAQGIQDPLEIHSPSKLAEWFGNMFSEGLALGIEEKGDDAAGASLNVAEKISNALGGAISKDSKLSEKLNGFVKSLGTSLGILDEDGKLTISAVLNMDEFDAQYKDLMKSASKGTAFNMTSSMSRLPREQGYNINLPYGASGIYGSGAVVFNQYNQSPKALSETEIYRSTRNLVSYSAETLKGGI